MQNSSSIDLITLAMSHRYDDCDMSLVSFDYCSIVINGFPTLIDKYLQPQNILC